MLRRAGYIAGMWARVLFIVGFNEYLYFPCLFEYWRFECLADSLFYFIRAKLNGMSHGSLTLRCVYFYLTKKMNACAIDVVELLMLM